MSAASRLKHAAAAVAIGAVLAPAVAGAQVYVGSNAPRRGAVEVSGGASWTAGQDLATSDASLTPNPGAGLGSVDLFEVDASLKSTIGGQATAGVYVSRAFMIEGGLRYSRPQLEVALSGDFEGAEDVTATSTITQYVFFGSLVYHFQADARVRPFVAAGAGHVRDVHELNELVETGTEFHGKVGVKMALGRRGRLALRAEGGISMIDGGFSFDEDRRVSPLAVIGLAYRF